MRALSFAVKMSFVREMMVLTVEEVEAISTMSFHAGSGGKGGVCIAPEVE